MLKKTNKFYDFLKAKEITGVFFGYPRCCIDFFLKRSEKLLKGDLEGMKLAKTQEGFNKGFIPCKECSETVKPGEEGNLITNRVCSKPFPEASDTELELFSTLYLLNEKRVQIKSKR